MAFKMIYDTRNRQNLNKLADKTKQKAYQLYDYCIKEGIQILIYETIRTKAQQAENVKKGVSKTMQSYHIVGQALDWVLVDSKKNALWNGYKSADAQKVIKYAKSIGFTSGFDWGWDAPHLQYDKIAYGKDTFGKSTTATPAKDSTQTIIKAIQTDLNAKYKANLTADGYYGEKTREALLRALKVEMNKSHTKEMGRAIKTIDGKWYVSLLDLWGKIILSKDVKTSKNIIYILQASLYVNGHTEIGDLDGVWGNNTTIALNNFRKKQGFKQDGRCGGSTWKALLEKVNK